MDELRQIIGNNSIVLFSSFSLQNLYLVTKYKNALFSNDAKLTEEFLESFSDVNQIKGLIKKFETGYKLKFNFDNNFLTFPNYKDKGHYSDLSF